MIVPLQTILLVACGVLPALAAAAFALTSWREGERRAARVSALLAAGLLVSSVGAAAIAPSLQLVLLLVLVTVGAVCAILFFLPVGLREVGHDIPRVSVDERDTIFARWRLRPGTPEYDTYYAMRPENQAVDDRARALPGLTSMGAKLADPYHFAAANGSFFLTDSLREAVDGPVAEERVGANAAELTDFVRALAKRYGALDVGITPLEPYHVYTHVGRGTGRYGAPIDVQHLYAIAITVEMDFEMIGTAPAAPVVMESARQYGEAARIAIPLAATLRNLGFPSRAHTDGNYRVIAPLVARDAGLGEIGRMGLLMTPRHGPRVRLAAVTTDAPLVANARLDGTAMIDFCGICMKCAENCPSRSIPFGDREEVDGALRWRIDADTCFRYWCTIGTDCARCMNVCPYAHPNTFSHNVLRWGIARSGFARRAALVMDDVFYGKKPVARQGPDWLRVTRGGDNA